MKQVALIFITIVLISIACKAQSLKSIPNGDFEQWDSVAFDNLDSPWVNPNYVYSSVFKRPTVTQVQGQTGKAVHLQNYVIGSDTLYGGVSNYFIPCPQTPTGIKGYYRSYFPGKDTGYIILEFIKSGSLQPPTYELIPFSGIDTNGFKAFNINFPNVLTDTPDYYYITIASYNIHDSVSGYATVTPGNWLEVDQISLLGPKGDIPIPGGDFETWSSAVVNHPKGWSSFTPGGSYSDFGYNDGVSKSTDHYSGNYSVKLTAEPNGNYIQLTNAILDKYGANRGGTPFQLPQDTLTGYYKYYPYINDTASIQVDIVRKDTMIGINFIDFAPASSWTYFQIPISNNYINEIPDTIQILASASNFYMAHGGSILYLDDLQLKSQYSSINPGNKMPDINITSFPNPAQNQLNIRFTSNAPKELGIKIYNSEGRLMIDNQFNSGSSTITVPIGQLSTGLYFYEVTANGSVVRNKFVKED